MCAQILGIVDVRLRVNPTSCDDFLAAVRAEPLPRPGDSILLQLKSAHTNRPENYKLTRPADSDRYLDVLNLDLVLRYVSPVNLVELFASLIRERRFVFMSSNVSVVSDCVQGILGLLYPFSWQYVLVPVLPTSLLNFCCAPVPFVVGINSADQPELHSLKSAMEEVILFDLDRDQFLWKPFVDSESIPPILRDQLLNGVKKASPYHSSILSAFRDKQQIKTAPPAKNLKQINNALADEFMAFFVQCLKDYNSCLFGLPGAEAWVFSRDAFLNNFKDPEMHAFLAELTSGQMFEQFIKEREANRDRYVGPFEQNVRMLNSLSRAKLGASSEKERDMIDTAIQGVTRQQPGFFSKIKNAFQGN
jgi:DENN domain-containing protein 2